jgi:hypothetical protein
MSETNKKILKINLLILKPSMYVRIIRYSDITVEAKSPIVFIYIISFGWKSPHHNLFFYTTRPASMLLSVLQTNTRT